MITERKRFASTALAVTLGVTLLTVALMLTSSFRASAYELEDARYVGADVVISGTGADNVDPAVADGIRQLPGARVDAVHDGFVEFDLEGRSGFLGLASPEVRESQIDQGRLPARDGEVAINKHSAQTGIAIGDELKVTDEDTLTVVGLGSGGSFDDPFPLGITTDATAIAHARDAAPSALLVSGVTVDQVNELPSVQGVDTLEVRTTDEATADAVRNSPMLQTLLTGSLSFAAVALVVSSLVISTTFDIIVSQSTRRIALLRCLGASSRQVKRMLVTDAFWVGLIGSILGTILGAGITAIAVAVASRASDPSVLSTFDVDAASVLVPVFVGVAVTLASTIRPIRRATKVAPLEALRAQTLAAGLPVSKRFTWLGVALLVFGGALLAVGGTQHLLGIAMPGGFFALIGLILILPAAVRATATVVTRFADARPSWSLGVRNANRQPRRSAGSIAGLFVGVTLVTTLLGGSHMARVSLLDYLDSRYGVDLIATASEFTPEIRDQVTGTAGVAESTVVESADVTVRTSDGEKQFLMVAATPEDAPVLHDPSSLDALDDSTVLVPDGVLDAPDLELVSGPESTTLRVARSSTPDMVVTPTILERFADGAPEERMWLRLDTDSPFAVVSDLQQIDGVQVSGPAASRHQLEQLLDAVTAIAVALVGFSVVISVIGVGNALAVSVTERRREFGLMRALGSTLRDVHHVVTSEAIVLGLVAGVLGTVAGTGFGIAGIAALLGSELEVTPAVSWPVLVIMPLASIAIAAAASWAPSRRAAGVQPAAAMVAE